MEVEEEEEWKVVVVDEKGGGWRVSDARATGNLEHLPAL